MTCPPAIASLVSQILQTGLLQIRATGWDGDAETAAHLADHLHNLPSLLREFTHDLLSFYWDVERPAFLNTVDEKYAATFAELWKQLEPHVIDSNRQSAILTSPE